MLIQQRWGKDHHTQGWLVVHPAVDFLSAHKHGAVVQPRNHERSSRFRYWQLEKVEIHEAT
jgi:hypothetical protein